MSLLRTNYKQCNNRDDEDELFEAHSEIRPSSQIEDTDSIPRRAKKYNKKVVLALIVISVLVVLALCGIVVCVFFPGVFPGSSGYSSSKYKSLNDFGQNPVVQTNCGAFVGEIEDGAFAFKGIPYAEPPTGPLRWKKPRPLWKNATWCKPNNYNKALNFGSSCFQLNPFRKQCEGTEDCLYLNVWTPTLDPGASLEVMVWIHGGFLQFGSGHQMSLSPNGKLASNLNMVFVSFNYRLHVLGYLALDVLYNSTDNEDSRGNFGLWDQLVVLKWIRDHIIYFGGDPRKVTVFGSDGGAASILVMLTSGHFRDTFRSAWLLGPTLLFNRSFGDTSAHNRAHFLEKSGCGPDPYCLRKMTPKEVTGTYIWNDDPSFRIRDQNDLPIQGILPEQLVVVDGEIVMTSPTEAALHRNVYDVPLLIGTSAQAVDFWPGPDDLHSWTWNQFRKYVTTSLDSFGPRVSQLALQLYNDTSPVNEEMATPELSYTTMVGDIRQTCPVNELSEMLSTVMTSPIYRYVVTSWPSEAVRVYNYPGIYSSHLWDAIAFFDSMEYYMKSPSVEDQNFRDNLRKIVVDFVKSGGKRVFHKNWRTYPKAIASVSTNVTIQDSYHKTKCKFWSAHGLTDYSWVS